ncbi:class I SAM-dependent methyltransferase [Flavobacterium maritimum]|uniref:class I SAM-dependent methyltransferase n=1 Tax=Flavobacterium maritimum TaxID=3149042 RepID=UPI0032B4E534
MNQIKYNHTEKTHNTRAAFEILPFVFNLINPKSIIDIGCGNGSWLKAATELGVAGIQGVDGVKVDGNQLNIPESNFLQHDLTKQLWLNKKFDLAISLEVAEHLPESAASNIIDALTTHSDCILFSAAVPGQGGQYHVNEQWPEYWHQKFKSKGYLAYDVLRNSFWNNENIFWWYRQNIILYAKKGVFNDNELQSSEIVNAIVHPELYRKKITHPKYITNKKELFKLAFQCLKLVLKR